MPSDMVSTKIYGVQSNETLEKNKKWHNQWHNE